MDLMRGKLPIRYLRKELVVYPDLQHWQDRLDSLPWEIASVFWYIDSVPT